MRHVILLLAFSLVSASVSQHNNDSRFYRAASTAKMEAQLRQIYAANDWKADPNKPAERTKYYRALLEQHLTPSQEVTVLIELAKELLRAGDSAASVNQLEQAAAFIHEKAPPAAPETVQHDLHKTLAIAYLRLGEQENCLDMHGQKSCIFPIRSSGVHMATRGAEGAVRELTALLNADPHDDISRWLLNIACMQLGLYPAKVPKQWIVLESRFASEYDIGEFSDVAPMANMGVTEHSGESSSTTSTATV